MFCVKRLDILPLCIRYNHGFYDIMLSYRCPFSSNQKKSKLYQKRVPNLGVLILVLCSSLEFNESLYTSTVIFAIPCIDVTHDIIWLESAHVKKPEEGQSLYRIGGFLNGLLRKWANLDQQAKQNIRTTVRFIENRWVWYNLCTIISCKALYPPLPKKTAKFQCIRDSIASWMFPLY